MIKILTAFLIIVSISQIYSQELSKNELDSLYNLFTFVRGVNNSDKMRQILDENPVEKKCGLGLVTSIKQNLKNFSIDQQIVLSKLLERPTLSDNAISSNGFFRVHYTTSGSDAIGYDLNLLLSALDSVYKFEITHLGYPLPPPDGIIGGDDKYDIYVMNIGDYGYTQPENNVGASNWTTYMVIDNDFGSQFYTHGIDAARVTVAHEFHHAVQMGNYAPINPSEPYRNADRFFYELTSTAFEEFVFDDVNDYYAYMPAYFGNPAQSFSEYSGYDIALWNIFLQKNFGFEILKNQWELIPNKSALEAIALSIFQQSSTLGNELNRFGIWTYFTGSRAIPGRYFEESINYVLLIAPTATVSFTPPSKTYDMTIVPVANFFLKINLPSSEGVFYSIITNSDYQKTTNQSFPFSYSVFNDTISGEKVINKNYSVSFSRDNQTFWNNAGILNDIVVYGDSSYSIPNLGGDTYAFPMPFKLSSHDYISIDFQSDLNNEEVDLNIYSAGLELYYSGKKSVQPPYLKDSKRYRRISLNKSDADFSSGVYFYIIKSGDNIYKGKLVIFND